MKYHNQKIFRLKTPCPTTPLENLNTERGHIYRSVGPGNELRAADYLGPNLQLPHFSEFKVLNLMQCVEKILISRSHENVDYSTVIVVRKQQVE